MQQSRLQGRRFGVKSAVKGIDMKTITPTLVWHDEDTTLESLKALAEESGVSEDVVIQRAIAEYLDRYAALPAVEIQEPASSLHELFINRGILKT